MLSIQKEHISLLFYNFQNKIKEKGEMWNEK